MKYNDATDSYTGKPNGPAKIPSPRPIGEPPKKSLSTMGYGDSTQKCDTCSHYDVEGSTCKLAGEEVDPMGHCAEYSAGGGEQPLKAPESGEMEQ